ncbi:hypothetical protein Glove_185g51 [Diversispora epigaea]|uniref:Tyrosinase copper-binding domain-containing protein n=1 Tax=Diversispora epigaea TaxID=1348612 RepID=A0A397IMH4_9GLOM|nr:hypothetical protein Glove_185g51 [Diversispora epigaea]
MNFRKLYDTNPLQKQFSDILFDRADEPATVPSWNTFIKKEVLTEDLLRSYYKLANANKNTSVKTVLDQAEKDVKTKDPRLVHQALMGFASTYPDAKKLRLRVPPLILRAPKNIKPKQRPILPGPMIGVPGKTPKNKEDLLEYWREDPNLNEHHEKWNLVYGKNRVVDPNNVGEFLWKDRKGEISMYELRQNLARYCAERLSVGLPDVKPLDNYDEEIPEGYESRPAGLKLRDVEGFFTVQNLADARDRLIKTIDQGYFDDLSNSKSIKTEGNIDLLGIAIEAGITESTYKNYDAAVWGTNYVPFHNIGHVQTAFIQEGKNLGVMGDTKTASRDPIYYRWHRHVDDLFVRYQSKLPPNNYNDVPEGYFDDLSNSKSIKTEGNIDLLGIAIEAGITESTYKNYDAAVWGTNYVPFHNIGHVQTAFIQEGKNLGVMGDTKTASRDPIYYRWHRHVDDLFVRYQSKLPPNNYNDVPEVYISNQDVALVFKDEIEAIKELTKRTDIELKAQEWGESHLDEIFNHNISTLETELKTRSLQLEGDDHPTKIRYLFPREWYYFFRVKNPNNKEVNITFRVFIVPTQFENQFNRYIEVDKFQRTLRADSETLISRDCDRSSEVSQPPKKTPEELNNNVAAIDEEDVDHSDYCECGYPFNLVIPRGNRDGLKFKLVVFLSNGELDKTDSVRKCESLSFCGFQELAGKYPDKKEMGYPFNRPLINGDLKDTFGDMKNVAVKEFKIKFIDDSQKLNYSRIH